MQYAPLPVPEPPKNSFDLYQREAYAAGIVATNNFDMRTHRGSSAKLDVTLSWGRNCEPKRLWVHLSRSDFTAETLANFLGIYSTQLEKLDIQARGGIQEPCVPGTNPEGYVPVSSDVYVYYDGNLSAAQREQLIELFAKRKLALNLRGPQYFDEKRKHWDADDIHRTVANSPHVIYLPGEP
jgi:hypothetical protein